AKGYQPQSGQLLLQIMPKVDMSQGPSINIMELSLYFLNKPLDFFRIFHVILICDNKNIRNNF
ncbi:MAG: hypothetical protein CG441_1420, partial [Methylococcaceae bacterium NSM2-1]